MKVFAKDSNAKLDYSINWAPWLVKAGNDAIQASEWIAPAGISATGETFTSTRTTIWLQGGELGQEYDLINRITTVGGRIEDCTIRIKIVAK